MTRAPTTYYETHLAARVPLLDLGHCAKDTAAWKTHHEALAGLGVDEGTGTSKDELQLQSHVSLPTHFSISEDVSLFGIYSLRYCRNVLEVLLRCLHDRCLGSETKLLPQKLGSATTSEGSTDNNDLLLFSSHFGY